MPFDEILAQEVAIGTLKVALERNRVPQSYLFSGPSGVGKQKTAMALVQARLCPKAPFSGCGHCEVCTRVAEHKHPDVRVFEARDTGNRNLQIETLRSDVLPFAKFAPFEAEAAFIIFPEADVQFPANHAESANALLKTLEEPRKNVHFILLSERPQRLLLTIRSRCQRLRFRRLPPEAITAILRAHGVDDRQVQAASALAAGRADRALDMAQAERASEMWQWAQRVDGALGRADAGGLLELGEDMARSEDRGIILETLALYYRALANQALGIDTGAELPAGAGQSPSGNSLGAGLCADRVYRIEQTAENLVRNANPEIALDAMLFGMLQAAAPR